MRRADAIRIQLLGTFHVQVGAREIPAAIWRRKAASLVKLLALAPDHHLHREVVTEELWPQLRPQAALNNLHRVLYQARRTLSPEAALSHLRFEGELLVLASSEVWIDVEAFVRGAEEAQHTRRIGKYRKVLELYRGELLPEDRFEDWTVTRREELSNLYLNLLTELSSLYEREGDYPAALETLQRVLQKEPALEAVHLDLMRLYALSGQRQRALEQFARLRRVLRREFRTAPSRESKELYRDLLVGSFPQAPPAQVRVTRAPSTNLRAASNSFVGRETELAELEPLLGETRLLTLTGTAGSGKTRLALELASRQHHVFEDGVWLVELAEIREPAELPDAVGRVFGSKEVVRTVGVLEEHLCDREALLILDNCEHLLESCAQLAKALLQGCPKLHLLVTSREALHLPGERVWRVPPLYTPDPHHPPPLEEVGDYDAVALFIARARLRRSDFTLTEANVGSVLQLLCGLEGLPLAIELAAARVDVLSEEQMAARLDDCLRLLRGRATTSRHGSLEAALDWSYSLLTEEEQSVFRSLAVFAGDFSLEAAEEVCAEPDGDVLEALSGLVYKSLLLVVERGRRYRFSKLIRQYATKKLEQTQAQRLRERHFAWALAFAQEVTRGEEVRLESIEAEGDNLRAALLFARDHEPEGGLRLALALAPLWRTGGHPQEGRAWLEDLLARTPQTPSDLRERAMNWLETLARGEEKPS